MTDKKKRIGFLLGILTVMFLSGCSVPGMDQKQNTNTPQTDTGFILAGPGSFDSADTAVVVDINKTEKTITFFNNGSS